MLLDETVLALSLATELIACSKELVRRDAGLTPPAWGLRHIRLEKEAAEGEQGEAVRSSMRLAPLIALLNSFNSCGGYLRMTYICGGYLRMTYIC